MPDVLLEVIGTHGTKVVFYRRDDWLIGITVSSISGTTDMSCEVGAHHLLDVVRTWSAAMRENVLTWRQWDEKQAAQKGTKD